MKTKIQLLLAILLLGFNALAISTPPLFGDSTKAYSMPLLSQSKQGSIFLSWTEKDAQGITSFCLASSKDKGQTFSDKKVIFAGSGVGNSRLMRAKLLFKKDGSLVAVFSNRMDTPAANQQGRGGPRNLQIVYCVSKDEGNTWTAPKPVDLDETKCTRGFFDATVMSNDEIAVVYLKDVANSTKHEERDLRLVVTKNGEFQPERVIDPVVCDCCNISLLVDAAGALNVFYRDNNDDIRDMAKMTSTDNGMTFSKPQIIVTDGWKISGCPHSGATSSIAGKSALIAWHSGTTNEPGIRLATQDGKRLFVLNEPSAKNAYLSATNNASIIFWEQNKPENNATQIAFRSVKGDKVSDTNWVNESQNGTNATGLVIDNQLLVAFEVKQNNKKNSIKLSTVKI